MNMNSFRSEKFGILMHVQLVLVQTMSILKHRAMWSIVLSKPVTQYVLVARNTSQLKVNVAVNVEQSDARLQTKMVQQSVKR